MTLIIGGFEVDVALVEEPTFPGEITSYPVESGSEKTDSYRLLPVELNIEGLVSDAPIGAIADRRDPSTVPSTEAYRFLLALRATREPFTVETNRDVFDNMLIETLTPPTLRHDGLRFRAIFRQVEFVTNERTTIPVSTPRAGKKVKRGVKPLKPGMTMNDVAKRRGYGSGQGREADATAAMLKDEEQFHKNHARWPTLKEDPRLGRFGQQQLPFSSF